MIQKERWIWMDGTFVPWDEAKVHVLSHTLHYGYGAFEGIRAYRLEDGRSAVFRLQEHIQRLLDSARLLELAVPYGIGDLCEASRETLAKNGMAEGYIRPLVYLGDREVGVYPGNSPDVQVAIITWRWGAYLGPEALQKGIRVKVSTYGKHHVNSLLVKGKICGHYVNSVLAKMEAKREGFDEGILLDHGGYVAEGSGENLFLVRDRVILTPGNDASILNGITRSSVITLARDMGLEVRETRLTRSDLYLADEVFFTGTAAEITPIREIDRRTVGSGEAGPVTRSLQQAFFDVVRGRDARYHRWLDFYQPVQS
ncbi:branched-chain amino acid transaminase [Myxococcota bacterium]|nr:branched-chain amino acid transaminase [Myxococcota bacterium]